MTVTKCANCGHLLSDHGDRVLGLCSYGRYPAQCACSDLIMTTTDDDPMDS